MMPLAEQKQQARIKRLHRSFEALIEIRNGVSSLDGQQGEGHAHFADGLPGNVAKISISLAGSAPGEEGIGESWIGASPLARDAVKRYVDEHGGEPVLAHKDGSIELPPSLGGCIMNNPPLGAKQGSLRDSEYPLLNAASHWLKLNFEPVGSLLLLSERIPCESCSGVIERFMHAHPNIEVDVHYLYESNKPALRHASDFNAHFANAASRPRLLYTQFLVDGTVRFQDVSEQTQKTQVNLVAGRKWAPSGFTSSAGYPTEEQDELWHANLSVSGYVGPKRSFPRSGTK